MNHRIKDYIKSFVYISKVYWKCTKRATLFRVLSILLSSLAIPISYCFLTKLIDVVFIGKQIPIFDVVFSVLIYALSMIVCSFSEWVSSFVGAEMKKDLAINLNDILIEKLSSIEYAYFENNTHILISKVSDALDESFYTFFEQIVAVVSKVISIMSFMVFFFSYSFTLGSILTLMVILSIVFCFKGARLRVFINKKFTQSERTLKYLRING